MTKLDETMTGVLSGMPQLPATIGREAMARLATIQQAIAANLIDEGSTLIQFTDLEGDVVVLSMIATQHYAHVNISTSEEAVVISRGYDMLIGEDEVQLIIDDGKTMTEIDHGALMMAHMATSRALRMIAEGRALMATHPVFKGMRN